jgi:5-methylcytosine-specific restriction endonuclease McrA
MPRKRFTDKDRARIFADNLGVCHICGEKIDGVREAWEIEHVIAWELTRDISASRTASYSQRKQHDHSRQTGRQGVGCG